MNFCLKKPFVFALSTVLFICAVIGLSACKDTGKTEISEDDIILDDNNQADNIHVKKVKKIFYNIPSPIEMASIMQKAGAVYNSELLNPVENIDKYPTIATSALNLGIYGADLSYTRLFDQIQESVNYLSVMRKLSDRLGIPQDEGSFAVNRMEENIDNRDSLLLIITETYSRADTYLKENDRGSTAALIIFGGWVEALFISIKTIDLEEPSDIIMKRIAEQKFSLNNLYDLLSTYQDDESIAKYIPKISQLKSVFDSITISYTNGKVITDTISKSTRIDSDVTVDVTIEHIKQIDEIISKIRVEIIQ